MEISWQRSLKVASVIMIFVLAFQLIFVKAGEVEWMAIPFSGLLYLALIYLVNQFRKTLSSSST